MLLGKGKANLLEEPTVESQIGLPTFSADWLSPSDTPDTSLFLYISILLAGSKLDPLDCIPDTQRRTF